MLYATVTTNQTTGHTNHTEQKPQYDFIMINNSTAQQVKLLIFILNKRPATDWPSLAVPGVTK